MGWGRLSALRGVDADADHREAADDESAGHPRRVPADTKEVLGTRLFRLVPLVGRHGRRERQRRRQRQRHQERHDLLHAFSSALVVRPNRPSILPERRPAATGSAEFQGVAGLCQKCGCGVRSERARARADWRPSTEANDLRKEGEEDEKSGEHAEAIYAGPGCLPAGVAGYEARGGRWQVQGRHQDVHQRGGDPGSRRHRLEGPASPYPAEIPSPAPRRTASLTWTSSSTASATPAQRTQTCSWSVPRDSTPRRCPTCLPPALSTASTSPSTTRQRTRGPCRWRAVRTGRPTTTR